MSGYRIALFADNGQQVSAWVDVRPDGSSAGPIEVLVDVTAVTSYGISTTPEGPVEQIPTDRLLYVTYGDSVQTPPLELR